jgi:hypothetical protein
MAVFEQYTPGLGSVGNYQVSGTPWVTGSLIAASGASGDLNSSTQHIRFAYVTKEVTVMNLGSTGLAVHLANDLGALGGTQVAAGNHMFMIPPSGTAGSLNRMTFDMKTKDLYVTNTTAGVGSYQIYASLTRIDKRRMFALTGSGINSEAGDGTVTP